MFYQQWNITENRPVHTSLVITILLTKTSAVPNEGALSYHRVRLLYIPTIVYDATIYEISARAGF